VFIPNRTIFIAMKKTNKFFVILRSFTFFAIAVMGIFILLHFVLVMYNDFFREETLAIIDRFSLLNISDDNKNYDILILTMELHSTRPITFSLTTIKKNRSLKQTKNENGELCTDSSISDMELELSKFICDRRSIFGDCRATYRMAFLPNGSIVILDKNITNQKNVTLDYILNNSRNKFIDQESNVEWGMMGFDSLEGRDLGRLWLGQGGCIILHGSIDNVEIYDILIKRYNPESESF
jgi:hypothetical protein